MLAFLRACNYGEVDISIILRAARKYIDAKSNYKNHVERCLMLKCSIFEQTFNHMSDHENLRLFRFKKRDVMRMAAVVRWDDVPHKSINLYRTTRLLGTAVFLKRLASPFRWQDLEVLFGKHAPQLSEIFWETLECFLDKRKGLLMGELNSNFLQPKLGLYANAVEKKCGTLENCVGFIDGTVIGVARPGDNGMQNVLYNGHRRTHAIKFRAIVVPDGMFLHPFGPLEGRRLDWILYTGSGLDEQLASVLEYAGM